MPRLCVRKVSVPAAAPRSHVCCIAGLFRLPHSPHRPRHRVDHHARWRRHWELSQWRWRQRPVLLPDRRRDRPQRHVCARCGANGPRHPSTSCHPVDGTPRPPNVPLAPTAHRAVCTDFPPRSVCSPAYGLKLSSSVCAPVSPRAASQDYSNHRIRRIDIATGSTTTLAGTSSSGSTNGAGASSQFNYPYGVAIDPSGSFALVAVRQLPPRRRVRPPPPLAPYSRLAHAGLCTARP